MQKNNYLLRYIAINLAKNNLGNRMEKFKLIIGVVGFLFYSVLSANDNSSVETLTANTGYQSAFVGQTRVKGVSANIDYQVNMITDKLVRPWGIVALPDGRLLVTEKYGTMRLVTLTGEVSEPITGLPTVEAGGQGGLLGVTIDPNFTDNRLVYWVFSEPVGDKFGGGFLTALAKGRLADNEASIENATVIYQAKPAYKGKYHYGGRVVFDNRGNLIISTGDRGSVQNRPMAQDVATGLGKIIRLNKEGKPPSNNAVFSTNNALPEVFSKGHRNPQGIAIHPVTGEIWQSEHGPRGGDEINRIQAGLDYGWPTIGYGIEYSGLPVGQGITQQDGMEQPIYYWDPVVSPSGMTFYTGDIAAWQNNLFIATLSGMHIIRLVIEDNKVVGEERLLVDEKQRFRDITMGADGALYAITDGEQGRIYQITQ